MLETFSGKQTDGMPHYTMVLLAFLAITQSLTVLVSAGGVTKVNYLPSQLILTAQSHDLLPRHTFTMQWKNPIQTKSD